MLRTARHGTGAPSLLHPEPFVVAAPGPQPASGDVLDPHAEDEVAPPPLPAGPVARGQRVVEHARHAEPDVGFSRCLSTVVSGIRPGMEGGEKGATYS